MKRRIIGLIALGLLVGPMSSQAMSIFISEYIEGSSNNKAIEIYNGTGALFDLTGYNIFMSFNGGTATLTFNLMGSVAAGDVWVVAQGSADPLILAQADQTSAAGAGWFNGDDFVALRMGTTVLDGIGQLGFDPGSQWGTGLTSTQDNTLRRMPGICAGDTNPNDAFDPATEWVGYATDTFDGLGSHTANCSSVPEPGTLALLGLGLFGLGLMRRRVTA
jgi:predicted extracellular nuclease